MTDFERESRYFVVKWSDAEKHLEPDDMETLGLIGANVEAGRMLDGKEPLDCVVVENDWPEYEPTWRAIEDRMKS